MKLFRLKILVPALAIVGIIIGVLWKSLGGSQAICLYRHQGPVLALALSEDESLVASGGVDGTIRLYDLALRSERFAISTDGVCSALAFSRDGKYLGYRSRSERKTELIFVDVLTGLTRASVDLTEHIPVDLVFTGNCDEIIVACDDGLHFINIKSPEKSSIVKAECDGFCRLALAPNGKFVAATTMCNHVIVWELSTRKQIRRFSAVYVAPSGLLYAKDGSLLAFANDKIVQVGLNPDEDKEFALFDASKTRNVSCAQILDGKLTCAFPRPSDPIGGFIWGSKIVEFTPKTNHQIFTLKNSAISEYRYFNDYRRVICGTFDGRVFLGTLDRE